MNGNKFVVVEKEGVAPQVEFEMNGEIMRFKFFQVLGNCFCKAGEPHENIKQRVCGEQKNRWCSKDDVY